MDWLAPVREVIGFVLPFLDSLPFIRALLAIVFVFCLPGFVWSLILFRHIEVIERMALSLGLSIALVTLGLLFMNRLAKIRITGFNSALVIIVLTILPVAIYYLNWFIERRRNKPI